MAPRRKTKADEARVRICHLIALDATNVVRRLQERSEEMVTLFSQLRSRQPLLDTIDSRFTSVRFEDLIQLEPPLQAAVNAFYESLESLRWYAQYTEDMPLAVRRNITQHQRRLELALVGLHAALGLPLEGSGPVVVDAEVVKAEVVKPESPVIRALPARASRRR